MGLQLQEEKEAITRELEETTTIRGIATELAIQAGEGKRKVEIPSVYDRFVQLFSEEASQRFPPSCPWDHAIDLKPDCNGHYNRTPDLGRCGTWWNVWDLARHTILDTKILDRNVTWLTQHKDTS